MNGMLLLAIVGFILIRGIFCKDAYGAFLRGAEQGMHTALRMLPPLCGMLMMLSVLNASGLTEIVTGLLSPFLSRTGVPDEVVPMLMLRPLTGSGSMAALEEVFRMSGPDSRAGRLASVLMSSSETIFYTLTIYAGAAGVRHVPGALTASIAGYAASAAVSILLTS